MKCHHQTETWKDILLFFLKKYTKNEDEADILWNFFGHIKN